jgi:phage shock protein PspC (stress-responsive transcriptional regulator)
MGIVGISDGIGDHVGMPVAVLRAARVVLVVEDVSGLSLSRRDVHLLALPPNGRIDTHIYSM